jgi:hypothetical protein
VALQISLCAVACYYVCAVACYYVCAVACYYVCAVACYYVCAVAYYYVCAVACYYVCVQWRAIMHWRRRLCEEMRSGRRMFYVSIFLLKSLCIRQFHCSSGVRIYNFILSSLFILFISCVFPFMSSVIYGPLNVALNNTLFSI